MAEKASTKKQIEKTSAEKTAIGFDYQYYFFLWKVLSLNIGESVGLEIKDDVHTELNNNRQVFYQIKHTTQKNNNNIPINLTELDSDLWKTISNWVKIVSDKNDGREDEISQKEFLKKTEFVLASNKSTSEKNNALNSISKFQNEEISFNDIKKYLEKLKNKTSNQEITRFIGDVLSLKDNALNIFLNKIFFTLDVNNIIQKCKDKIKEKMVKPSQVENVFRNLDSAIKEDNFINIRNGGKVEITFSDFYTKYKRYFELSRDGSLQISEFIGDLPQTLEDQVFIKQILEIGDIESDNIEEIAMLSLYRLKLKNNLDNWEQSGDLTGEEIQRFKYNAISKWENKFRSTYRNGVTGGKDNIKALEILDLMRTENLMISGQILETDMSNGLFYDLSNIPEIGWRKDWQKYNQDKK